MRNEQKEELRIRNKVNFTIGYSTVSLVAVTLVVAATSAVASFATRSLFTSTTVVDSYAVVSGLSLDLMVRVCLGSRSQCSNQGFLSFEHLARHSCFRFDRNICRYSGCRSQIG